MFSSRLEWNATPNRLGAALQARRLSGAPILDLTESNPTLAGLEYPEAGMLASLADARSLRYHPDPRGLPEPRSAISDYYARRGITVPPSRIILSASTSEAYGWLFKLLADPGDEVLVPRPSYPLFDYLAALESVRVRRYPLVYHGGWMLDLDALEHALTERTRAVLLVNPNNPTGSFLKMDELRALISLCRGRNIAIVSDEVFADYAFEPDPRRAAILAEVEEVLSFSLSGLSKVSGLPQMKLGWIAAAGPGELRNRALEALELIADTYLSVAAPVQFAAARLLEAGAAVRQQICARTRRNLDLLQDAVRPESGCRVLKLEGGWYATLQAPRIVPEEEIVLSLLDKSSVLVQPGFFYDFESETYLVLSLLTPEDIFAEGVRRLLDHLAEIHA